jgi:hypothetical protein
LCISACVGPPHERQALRNQCHTPDTLARENHLDVGSGERIEQQSSGPVADVDEVGLVTQLVFAIPLLRTLVQAVAESEGDWNYLNVSVRSGAWIGVARRAWESQLAVSTNGGARTAEPYPAPLHEALVGHGFDFVAEHEGYLRLMAFESDDVFTDVARLIVGTLSHVWGSAMTDHAQVELQLSLPPTSEAVD